MLREESLEDQNLAIWVRVEYLKPTGLSLYSYVKQKLIGFNGQMTKIPFLWA